jgi:hypothetical protein
MAAGTKSKVRLYEPSSERVQKSEEWNKLMQHGAGFNNTLHFYEVEYTAAYSNGLTEISIPNAVYDGTTVSVPLALVSDDNTQDKLAGTAAQKVNIINLDANGLPNNLEKEMSGTTAVLIDTFPQRLDHMYISQVGSSGDAEGNILLVRRGYQELATPTAITGATETGLTENMTYYFKLNINGAGVLEYYFTVTTASCTFANLITYLAGAKKVVGDAVISGVTFSIEGGDFRCTSNATTDAAAIAITAGTTGTDLLASLTDFASMDTAVGSGYQELGLTGITGATETGLVPQKEYFFKIALNGGVAAEYYITATTAAVTYTQLIDLLNSAILESDDVTVISGVTFSLTGGDVRATSNSLLDTAAVALTAGTSGTDLFSAQGLNCTPDTAVGSGYQECGFTGKLASTDTGIVPNELYYFKIALNGGGVVEYYITATDAVTTYDELVVLLNAAKKQTDNTAITGVTFALTGGNIIATSALQTATSAVAITAGTTGTDLLSVDGINVTVDAANYIGYQECGLTGKVSENLTGLVASSQYYFKVAPDGGAAVEYDITTATDLSFTSVLALLNTATTGVATWSLTGGDLRCTSDQTTVGAKILLTAGTTGDDMFAQLTGFSAVETEIYIGQQGMGLSGITGSTTSGLDAAAEIMYYKINIDGAGSAEESITVTAGATLFSDIITLLNAGIAGATFAINTGDLRCTSAATTDAAAIALSVAGLSGTSLFGEMTGFSAFETAGGTGYQEFGQSGKALGDATGLSAVQTYYYKANVDGAGVAEKNFNVTAGTTTFTGILTALNASIVGAVWSVTGGDLRLTSSTSGATSAIALSYATLSGSSFIESLTGFSALDASAGIGYQEFGLTGKTLNTETGLSATHLYYFKVNLNGAGAVEYHITLTPTSDTTYAGVVALMNTAITAIAAEFSYPDGKLRCTSESGGATSAIALTAGSTGDDLFASLTSWTDFDSAVAYAFYLTIAAGTSESDGAAFWMPEGYNMWVPSAELTVTTYAAAAHRLTNKIARSDFDGEGSAPDFSYNLISATVDDPTVKLEFPEIYTADSGGKVTFYETYIAAAETGFFKAVLAIYDPSNTGRGIDS